MACVKKIRANPQQFDAETFANAQIVPAVIIEGVSLRRARDLVLDESGRANFLRFEVVQETVRRFYDGFTYQVVAKLMAHMLYRALLSNGEAKYHAVQRIMDGKERQNKQVKDLRNHLDQHLFTAFLLGNAVFEQVVLYFKYKVDKIEAGENDPQLLFDAKLGVLKELRALYTSNSDDFGPITEIGWAENGAYVIGGNDAVNARLIAEMEGFRNGTSVGDEDKVTLPTKKERESLSGMLRSDACKSLADYFNGMPDDQRIRLDEVTYFSEQRDKVLSELLPTMHPATQEVINAVKSERNMERYAQTWKDLDALIAMATANEAIETDEAIEEENSAS
ncbi:unnamed protein product [marine sediment metagenome]|uniref:Uncharacterized protein n=1 Tax=marine sediment metagenome TaxID=412755 RepID=X0RXG9_9ZZZZ